MAAPAVDTPPPLLARVARAKRVVEVGAGVAFGTALALQQAAPRAAFVLTDVDPRVLDAPAPLAGLVHDVTRDAPEALAGADFVYAVRPPEELQGAILLLADRLGADVAMRPLKDEWAELPLGWRRFEVWPSGWRHWPSRRR